MYEYGHLLLYYGGVLRAVFSGDYTRDYWPRTSSRLEVNSDHVGCVYIKMLMFLNDDDGYEAADDNDV